MLGQLGRTQQAQTEFEEAVRLKPDFAEAHGNLGALLFSLGQADEAIEQLREVVRLKPDYADAHSNLGIALVSAGKTAEGVEQFEQALKLKPDITGYANLAMAYVQEGRSEEAILTADRAVAMARAGTTGDGAKNRRLAQRLPQKPLIVVKPGVCSRGRIISASHAATTRSDSWLAPRPDLALRSAEFRSAHCSG